MNNSHRSGFVDKLKSFQITTIVAIALIGAGVWWASSFQTARADEMIMYKNIGCGCCSKWADQLKAKGHTVIEKALKTSMPSRRNTRSRKNIRAVIRH